ncbi:MAG TPA: PKD domain-containing protein [Tepidisphaeraceae bacterium]|nr:PKD domain-containing protein [Tepidisphaeraceae bacterium]
MHLWFLLPFPNPANAWFDAAWPYRRTIDVTWDAEHGSGDQLAAAEFYSDGHTLPNADDVRVASEDGKLVPTHILQDGPGDRIRLAFTLKKGVKKYAVYFGNPKPEASKETEDVKWTAGLMLETRAWSGGGAGSAADLERSWNRNTRTLGQAVIPTPFIGYNYFGPQEQWISKFIGSLFAPIDGQYAFAISVDDSAALFIDGKPLLFAPIGPPDVRYNAAVHLSRGRHELLLYHLNTGGDGRVAVAWQRPDNGKFELIPREAFGICYGCQVGQLEQQGRSLLADFAAEQIGECFVADHYSFRYHFKAHSRAASPLKYEWDFGDGQTATQPDVDHVFLDADVLPVRLTVRVGPNSDTQTIRLPISRLWDRITTPPSEDPPAQSKVIADYDLTKMPPNDLMRATLLHLRAQKLDAALSTGDELAKSQTVPQPAAAYDALLELDRALLQAGQPNEVAKLWDRVPVDSQLQPRAARRAAQIAMWWAGDLEKAVKLLEPLTRRHDHATERLYGEALILAGNGERGRQVLLDLPEQGQTDRAAALSGASARSVEYFITEGDAEAGEDAWERWQTKFPADFVEGYSLLLRVKLIELRKQPTTAARVAEAFATAMPKSSYAPQLLDRASKLLAKTDSKKSAALRQLLKQKYPEDPLSQ